jgi:hypothetical protein
MTKCGSWKWEGYSLFIVMSRLALGLTQPSIIWEAVELFKQAKLPGNKPTTQFHPVPSIITKSLCGAEHHFEGPSVV